ncbi:MAG: DegT/DnrJ/EryC1/StrS family aminotransferase [Bacilli bacterium]|uniref:DegT/DnrJ/EryC1/StrS family aminotransferase n=1 Tax=Anaerorhabdus sp. TaxID=1872524 RepID=UPI002FCBB593
MKVSHNRLDKQLFDHKDEYMHVVERVLDSGLFILGPEVNKFEDNFAKHNNAKYRLD